MGTARRERPAQYEHRPQEQPDRDHEKGIVPQRAQPALGAPRSPVKQGKGRNDKEDHFRAPEHEAGRRESERESQHGPGSAPRRRPGQHPGDGAEEHGKPGSAADAGQAGGDRAGGGAAIAGGLALAGGRSSPPCQPGRGALADNRPRRRPR